MDSQIPLIAMDGPSGTGKSTVCCMVADALGWHFLDSGALYRLIALWSLSHPDLLDDQEQLTQKLHEHEFFCTCQDGNSVLYVDQKPCPEIRSPEVGERASVVGKMPMIREVLLPVQRGFLKKPGLVTEGRDMATVVFPQASHPIYLDASATVRAKRRYNQLHMQKSNVSLADLEGKMRARDQRDRTRSIAPLRPSERSFLIDTSNMTLEEVRDRIIDHVRASFGG